VTDGTASALADALRDRYVLERELGRGGMATVYLARDLRHDRPVALKILHPELAQALGAERFQREIRMAARLQHPHILTVYDSGEVPAPPGGSPILWFTMPFIEGESLRDRLNREKQLPLDDALRIAREAADALDYAHHHGVIHRDIKPENILLTPRHALVADFGIARGLSGGAEEKLTQTGMAVGTPAYMSPEQAGGERELDARTDIYSLATVLYEMLAGETPFSGPTAQAMIARRFMETPRPLRQLRETVPEGVEQAVQKGLARAPADRYMSAAEFAQALGPVVITPTAVQVVSPPAGTLVTPSPAVAPTAPTASIRIPGRRPAGRRIPTALAFVLGILVMASTAMILWHRGHRAGATTEAAGGPKLLAVLPFENLGAGEDEYFADGMTDAVRGKLANLAGFRVISRSSSGQYKKSTKSPQQIGQELGVQYLLTATVRWEKSGGGNRVQVSPELIQVEDATTRWQQPFDAALTDVFQVQADIAGRVAQALDVALGAAERQTIAEKPTQNLAAYDAFLKGEEISNSLGAADPTILKEAAGYYQQAVALDSGFAIAWAQLSRVDSYTYYLNPTTPALADAAQRAAARALALAPNRADGHLALGDYYHNVKSDFARAIAEYGQGHAVAPTNADLLAATGRSEQSLGHWEDALRHFQQAQTLDPRSVSTARRLAITFLWLHRLPEAQETAERGLALAPSNLSLLEAKAMSRLAGGDLDGGRAVLRTPPSGVNAGAFAAYVATYWDLFWVLDGPQQRLLVRLGPDAFDGNRAQWAICLTQVYALLGDRAHTQVYADSARQAYEEQLRTTPNDPQLTVFLGLALAYLGRKAEAVQAGERSLVLAPMSKDAYTASYVLHQVARLYALVGEPDKAIDRLETLLKIPYYVSPGWLKIDPAFNSLRKLPRFQKLQTASPGRRAEAAQAHPAT
jgi:TolB-like protein/Flp pilus assembly protein TadD